MKLELVATATFGLEAVVRREIENLGYEVIKTEDGRITYSGDWTAVARSNLWLRAADRVYIKMGEFRAETFEDLYQNVKRISWEDLIPKDGKTITIGTSVKSQLHSVPACQSICKKAIVDRLGRAYGMSELPETGTEYTVRFSLLKDQVLIFMDTSGEGLHKRGYRVANVEAPIKETLAAAMVELSFWNKDRILVDPCCGSGTIGIEAALIGLNIAPGIGRHFAAENWEVIPKEVWKEQRKQAYALMDQETELRIVCGDISTQALQAAKENAEAAGVDEHIEFIRGDMATLSEDMKWQPEDRGIIITNPPYGERIGEDKSIAKIFSCLKKFLKNNPAWSLFIITTDKDAEKKIRGGKADRRRKLYNGRIETCYYQFHGEKKAQERNT